MKVSETRMSKWVMCDMSKLDRIRNKYIKVKSNGEGKQERNNCDGSLTARREMNELRDRSRKWVKRE